MPTVTAIACFSLAVARGKPATMTKAIMVKVKAYTSPVVMPPGRGAPNTDWNNQRAGSIVQLRYGWGKPGPGSMPVSVQ